MEFAQLFCTTTQLGTRGNRNTRARKRINTRANKYQSIAFKQIYTRENKYQQPNW